ncbi:hypothetical protein NLU13_1517 [Sarocladium strictum]|uniref:Uncharacterized protein n=1 Tax=Sarocladium strictum TaxID=5046 RepID=A0AA39GT44_SARSR|nr:hypothetical protein NLU13_1517 [Sarocladium strictum]
MYYSLTTQTCTAVRHAFRLHRAHQRLFSNTPILRISSTGNLDRMSANELAPELAKAETEKTGTGPVAGGPAATAQSIKDSQGNLEDTVHEDASKAPEELPNEDAAKLQSWEDRIYSFGTLGTDTNVSAVQSEADNNASSQQ